MHITVRPVESAADRKAFVELAFCLNADDPNWVPPLKQEVYGLITPRKNPWFEHAEAQLFVAERDGCALLFACWLVLSHDHRTAWSPSCGDVRPSLY